jgi:hypothetical protein
LGVICVMESDKDVAPTEQGLRRFSVRGDAGVSWTAAAISATWDRGGKTNAECRELSERHRSVAGYKSCTGPEKSDFVHLARFPQSDSGLVRNPRQSRFG